MIKLSKEHPYEDACKILHVSPIANWKSYKLSEQARNFIKMETIAKDSNIVRWYVYAWCYTSDFSGHAGLVDCYSRRGLGIAGGGVGTALEFKDRKTVNKFQELCKPLIIKYLLNRDDHENFEICF